MKLESSAPIVDKDPALQSGGGELEGIAKALRPVDLLQLGDSKGIEGLELLRQVRNGTGRTTLSAN